MESGSVQGEQHSTVKQSLPAGASGVRTSGPRDKIGAFFDLQMKRREEEELNARIEDRKQVFESLQQCMCEMQKKCKELGELYSSYMFLKDEDANKAAEKAKREKMENLQQEAEIKRLNEVFAELMVKIQKLQHEVQRYTVYQDFMERVVKMTKFEDAKLLTGHLESLLYFRDQLWQRESEVQEQADQQRKALLRLEDQHHLLQLHKNNQLSQLQTELEKTCSEAITWEKQWNHIQETAAKKTLLLGRIKMATLNLFETTNDKEEEDEGVDMNDTEKQLDKVKMFIESHIEILKQHQSLSQRNSDEQKKKEQRRDKAKKQITTQSKKD